ncbi:hypothetical protein EDB83DRAFT_2518323 [Lactarius deliciosus]|nr:hypothetical protein EDB83DRAFT_2518323 [Lactarius deliciosus]
MPLDDDGEDGDLNVGGDADADDRVWPGGTCTICLGGGDGEDHAGGGRAGYRRRLSSRVLPFGITVRTTSPFDDNDARCKSVEWLPSRALTSVPFRINVCTTPPDDDDDNACDARYKGVSSRALASPPSWMKYCTVLALLDDDARSNNLWRRELASAPFSINNRTIST